MMGTRPDGIACGRSATDDAQQVARPESETSGEPLFSLCMPVHNGVHVLPTLFRSLAEQSYQDWDLVIVDDGSDDGTAEWLERQTMVPRERCTIYHQERAGAYAARVRAMRCARGRYVLPVDADDSYVCERSLAILADRVADDPGTDLWLFDAVRSTDGTTVLTLPVGGENGRVDLGDVRTRFLASYELNPLWCKIVRRDIAQAGYDSVPRGLSIGEDRLAVASWLDRVNSVRVIDECVYRYNVEGGSLLRKVYRRSSFDELMMVENKVLQHARAWNMDATLVYVLVVREALGAVRRLIRSRPSLATAWREASHIASHPLYRQARSATSRKHTGLACSLAAQLLDITWSR